MQNLTVIPGYWDENRAHHDEGYTLIIGHRRFAAGKMAGVTMYPCRIVQDMSYKDQVGTMLEENMQRIDLTVLEQAEGFQMMLNLGDTEEQIAEKTGFSRTTVHRRLEIAKLDRDLVKEKTDENGAYQLGIDIRDSTGCHFKFLSFSVFSRFSPVFISFWTVVYRNTV